MTAAWRILVVEDYAPFREAICLSLRQRTEFQVFESPDGLDAVEKAKQLQPDLVLFDIGLPKLNGIEAARQVRTLVPNGKVMFVSQEASSDVIRETFRLGGQGYVHKQHAMTDLIPAIEAVLAGEQFVSSGLDFDDDGIATSVRRKIVPRDDLPCWRVESSQGEDHEQFRLVANTAPVMIWMSGVDKLCTYVNQPWLDFTGRPVEAEIGNGWAQGVHPDDFKQCLDTYINCFNRREPFKMEYRLRRYDGEYRWVFDSGVPRFNKDGSFAGYIGSAMDVTERKLVEATMSTIGQRLIEAQEQERAWIARELHDDISQRLASLALNLSGLKAQAMPAEIRDGIGRAMLDCSTLSKDIRTLSHRLHSAHLEYLGLVAAASAFCRERSTQHKVEIDFRSEDVPKELPYETGLCLFRVLQEAIQNAIKHSGSAEISVSVCGGADEIELVVRDGGIGFDAHEAGKGRGLGLTSMKERLKLVRGNVVIESQPGGGTTIYARVPVEVRQEVIAKRNVS